MSYPEIVVFLVSGTKYYVEVDIEKNECSREDMHCHVTDGKRRIAQVSLSPIEFNGMPAEIVEKDQKRILEAISEQRPTLEYAYNHNRKYGTN
ncbi:MAG: hypothetical protein J6B87_00120 [Clostridia bacterium]|nr:hypothetical protein [Clostridia bacterium]